MEEKFNSLHTHINDALVYIIWTWQQKEGEKVRKFSLFFCLMVIFLSVAFIKYPVARGNSGNFYLELVGTITLDEKPLCIAVNEETNRVYVGTGQNLTVIDGETNDVILEIQLDFKVEVLAVNPRTNHVYASGDSAPSDKGTYVIDGSSGSVVGYLKNKAWDQHGIAVNPSTNLVYIADWATILGYPDLVMVYRGRP